MNTKIVKIADLKEIPEFRNFYSVSSNDDLISSLKIDGQQLPITISEDGYIIDGYRRYDALKIIGVTELSAIVKRLKPILYDRMLLNQYRIKNSDDQIQEIKYLFKRFPKRQGVKSENGEKYMRNVMISAGTNGRFKGDKVIKKLEEIIENDTIQNTLLKGIIEKYWKVDTCHEFINETSKLDKENNYGFTEKLVKGEISVTDANKLIKQMYSISKGINHTFSIPKKCSSYSINCVDISKMKEHKNSVDLILTSPPYFELRKYQNGDANQIGHEKTTEEYCNNVAKIIGSIVPTLKDTSNIMINVGDSYENGVGLGIPHRLKQSIEKNTNLIYKDTLIWSKPNPKPQSEKVQRPINNIEYIFWFVVDPTKSKYNMLTYPVPEKVPKVSKGAKDADKNGNITRGNLSISKPYGKIFSHLEEQEIEKIIKCSVGKNSDVYNICSDGHPAIMSSMLPVVPILMTTDEGDTVYDPFSGSNVVGRMSLLLNRVALSTELSEKYFKIGCRMLEKSVEDYNQKDLNQINSIVYSNYNLKSAA